MFVLLLGDADGTPLGAEDFDRTASAATTRETDDDVFQKRNRVCFCKLAILSDANSIF